MSAGSTTGRRVAGTSAALLLATVTTVSGCVLLSPRQTWSGPVQYWVDSAGSSTPFPGPNYGSGYIWYLSGPGATRQEPRAASTNRRSAVPASTTSGCSDRRSGEETP